MKIYKYTYIRTTVVLVLQDMDSWTVLSIPVSVPEGEATAGDVGMSFTSCSNHGCSDLLSFSHRTCRGSADLLSETQRPLWRLMSV